ncbi:hypothetical protein [Bosea massiliensis]|uniref:Uncharacterized protein n=1 Tax=Bosea massiliensis TaxID=151419 RepID=A0ABW0PBQ0_9HYPH
MTNPILNISTQKVGGLRFVRIGRLSLSFCLTRKPVARPVKLTAKPMVERAGDAFYPVVRLYRDGKLATIKAGPVHHASPADALAHARAAIARCGLTLAR